jgi:hypothetical protein
MGGATTSDTGVNAIQFQVDSFAFIGYSTNFLITTQVFRDPSAWYHFVVAFDSTQATASNRIKMYVNGVQITNFSTDNRASITQNGDYGINQAALHTIGYQSVAFGSNYLDGYLTEINFIDGQALDPTSFGEFDADTGVWKPLSYSGSYGTNGFYLNFNDPTSTATISQDQSGNGNDWTSNNISLTSGSTYDSMTDVPTLTGINTANYATANPLDADSSISITDGNLKATASTATHNNARTTISCGSSGYFYSELTYGSTVGGATAFAWGLYSPTFRIDNGTHPISASSGFYGLYASAGSAMYTNGSTGSSVTVSTGSAGDILQLAYDVASGNLWFGKNNVWYDSAGGTTGNPSTGANPTITSVETDRIFGFDIVSNTLYFNFGQRPFTYTPPTGFKSLNTYNLPDSTVDNGSEQFNTVLYTGTGTTQSITGVGFQPDAVWIKSRSQVTNHGLHDALRLTAGGNPAILYPNDTAAESSGGRWLNTLDSDGFTLNSNTAGNNSGSSYVAWNWKANGSGVSNTVGTIPSTVSANTTSGFSIVSYTGTGSASTVGHGLGVAPSMIIFKNRDGAYDWATYHKDLTSAAYTVYLSLNYAQSTNSTVANYYNSTAPTSSVFSIGASNNYTNLSSNKYIAYCFSDIEGFSSFGSYTGNGSADGPFIYTGFRPAWIMVKRYTAVGNWQMFDSARDLYNPEDGRLYANLTDAENDQASVDFVSNGFKMRDTSGDNNSSNESYLYMAFAENPFKNSLAR